MKKICVASCMLFSLIILFIGSSMASDYTFVFGNGKVFVVDESRDDFAATIEWGGKGGWNGNLTPDLQKAYVFAGEEGQNKVGVFDAKNLKLLKEIPTGPMPFHGIVSPDGRLVGVNHAGLTPEGKLRVSFIDVKTDEVVKIIELPVEHKGAKGLVSYHNGWSLDGRFFFTGNNFDNKFYAIDTKDGFAVVKEAAFESLPHYFTPSNDNKELWIVLEGGKANAKPRIVVMSIPSLKVTHEINMSAELGEVIEAHHGTFTLDGAYYYLCTTWADPKREGTSIRIFDVKTKKEVKHLVAGGKGGAHALNTPDGRFIVITKHGDKVLTLINAKTHEKIKELNVGEGHAAYHAVSKDNTRLYVPDASGLYVVTLEPFAVVKKLDVPGGAGQAMNRYVIYPELPVVSGK
ncbi:MAG: hypothetical protein HY756_12110 [Nitrospirae bacterium]|nr:hypothetical protein [Nitrospirota bacterium]